MTLLKKIILICMLILFGFNIHGQDTIPASYFSNPINRNPRGVIVGLGICVIFGNGIPYVRGVLGNNFGL